ncbi:CesD/SycD/LcrH family type III secretion system chaperone [Hahella sp. CCB-MM4]|uniref:SycD/LcrH family type III secretion system chaperone n=1 Tax=Hahella sp. (strain CCB-MM4) TaxID=1926491 RepID=UPI000B9AB41C|nr:SycD/LcrH family type III secretion system chaperone [Hahella sp. CCB-MM4]OZG74322.1 CesD/SycD/LcrH family type III secretion system chaperone [Hahella sp. CCB-MM4]
MNQNSQDHQQTCSADEMIALILEQGGTLALAKGLTQEEIEAIYTIAYNLYQQRKFEQAEQVFTFLCLYSHLDVRFWVGLAANREALGKFATAIEAYSYSALLQHDNPIPPLQAAKCYMALNNLEQARNGLNAAIHWSQDKPQHQAILGKAQLLLKKINDLDKRTKI